MYFMTFERVFPPHVTNITLETRVKQNYVADGRQIYFFFLICFHNLY